MSRAGGRAKRVDAGSPPSDAGGAIGVWTQPGGRPGQQNARAGERTNLEWQGQTAGFCYVVVDAMLETGFTPDEIGKIGDRFVFDATRFVFQVVVIG